MRRIRFYIGLLPLQIGFFGFLGQSILKLISVFLQEVILFSKRAFLCFSFHRQEYRERIDLLLANQSLKFEKSKKTEFKILHMME